MNTEVEKAIQNTFIPLDALKNRPTPESFNDVYKVNTEDDSTYRIQNFTENKVKENSSLDRNKILEKLKNKGILVKPCVVKERSESRASSIQDDNMDDFIQPVDPPQKIKKKTNIQISFDDTEKDLEVEEEEAPPVSLPKKPTYNEKEVEDNLLVDSNTVLMICYDKNTEKAPGEKIPKTRVASYQKLFTILDWRIKLCNSYKVSFVIDDVTYENVDHYVLASQYKTFDKPDLLATLEGAMAVHKNKKYKPDENYEKKLKQNLFDALYAKFTQNQEFAQILHATNDATLIQRITSHKKTVFSELMWLRQILKEYVERTIRPLPEVDAPKKTNVAVLEKEMDVHDISIGQYATQLPKFKPQILKTSYHYLNNRRNFINTINQVYREFNDRKFPTNKFAESFDIMEHQKTVRNYINTWTPYHGLLLYHNLGAGKSCTSISVTEGMKSTKKVYVLLPASLKNNYWAELQKCGNLLYRQNQYWEFVSVQGKPELVPVLAKALSMSTIQIQKKKGAWMVDSQKEPNFSSLSSENQMAVQEQIIHMINKKYIPIHYNASNLQKIVAEYSAAYSNLFDNSVVVIDEAHNFVTKIVNNLKQKKKSSPYVKLYEKLLSAKNARIVMLSGTPIINEPHEMSVMFNILRGYIYTWTFVIQRKDKGSSKINSDYINKLLNQNDCLVHDFVEYTGNTLLITRNPFGFVNVTKKQTNTRKNQLATQNTTQRAQYGGFGKYGVTLDEQGKVSNDQFIEKVRTVLEANGLMVVGNPKMEAEKCLPDDYKKFMDTFIKSTTDYSDKKNTESDLLKVQTLRKRILGLSSYFRYQGDDLLPKFIKDANGNVYNEVKVEMSDYQMSIYAKIRKKEFEKEKQMRTMNKKNKQVKNSELFQISSTYRSASRTCCNFVFPPEIPRPVRSLKEGEQPEDAEGEEVQYVQGEEGKEEEGQPVELESDREYQQKIMNTMEALRKNAKTHFSVKQLSVLSPKMLEIIRRIKSTEHVGLHLLYSGFRTLEGIGIFQIVLENFGFKPFKLKLRDGSWVLDYENDGRPTYVLYTGTEDPKYREIIRNIYNGDLEPPNVPKNISDQLKQISLDNKKGQLIKLFMITAAGAEGINLKNTRYVHIMEPYWHNVRLEQVVGRARRLKSHFDLEEQYRTVQVFLYLSVMSEEQKNNGSFKEIVINDLSRIKENTPITTDEYLYEISQMKQKINNQLLRVIKETSMDCHLYEKSHKKTETLVCYGNNDSSMDQNYVSHPSYKKDLTFDNDVWNVDKTKVQPEDEEEEDREEAKQPEEDREEEKQPEENREEEAKQPIMDEPEDNEDEFKDKTYYQSKEFIDKVPEMAKKLYDPNVVFIFHSKSPNKAPGKGTSESLPSALAPEYSTLNEIPEWRQKLSNFWGSDNGLFELDGKKWFSVEHYYQGSKFKKENPEFYNKFSLDSNSDLSKNPAMSKGAGGKSGKYLNIQVRPKGIKADKDFFSERTKSEMYLSQYAKFTQNEELKTLLKETKQARLLHHVQRQKEKEEFVNLMVIRDLLSTGKI